MRVRKSFAYTVYGVGGIVIGIVSIVGAITENESVGYMCGVPALMVGIPLLIRGIYHIKKDHRLF